jgi:hypothetical protein
MGFSFLVHGDHMEAVGAPKFQPGSLYHPKSMLLSIVFGTINSLLVRYTAISYGIMLYDRFLTVWPVAFLVMAKGSNSLRGKKLCGLDCFAIRVVCASRSCG